MAIIVQDQRDRIGFLTIVIWLFLLLLIGSAIYYIFFKQPEFIEFGVPTSLENIQELSKIELNPSDVVSDPKFQKLKQYVSPPLPPTLGQPNPFLRF